jgi:hypothetical protein
MSTCYCGDGTTGPHVFDKNGWCCICGLFDATKIKTVMSDAKFAALNAQNDSDMAAIADDHAMYR